MDLHFAASNHDVGVWHWVMKADLVYVDAIAARLIKAPPSAVERGLPSAAYYESIHPEDRERMQRGVRAHLLQNVPYDEVYRIVSGGEVVARVRSSGRCARDTSGQPAFFFGTVRRWDEDAASLDRIVDHILAAMYLAREAKEAMTEKLLKAVLMNVGYELAGRIKASEKRASEGHEEPREPTSDG